MIKRDREKDGVGIVTLGGRGGAAPPPPPAPPRCWAAGYRGLLLRES